MMKTLEETCFQELETLAREYDWHEFLEDVDEEREESRKAYLFSQQSIASYSQFETSFVCADDMSSIQDGQSSSSTALNHSSSSESLETVLSTEGGDDKEEESIAESSDGDARLCLKELNVSDSHLKLFNYRFPVPEDPGIVPGFWILYPKPPAYENDGVTKFMDLIRTMKLQPIRKVSEMLKTDEVNLRYYGLDPRTVRAICESAFHNTTVKTLDLQDNWLTVDACFHLNDLLVNNEVLSSLNLSGCRIGPRGAKRLQEGIGASPSLQYLNVSRCDLGDEGAQYITIGIYCSSSLLTVDLTDNNLGDGSGAAFQTMLAQTDSVTQLNLSWNSLFNQEFWTKFVAGLSRNLTLIDLDMSWNALGKDCMPFLGKYLSSPSSLRKLNLRGNRFEKEEATQIAKALMKNSTLETLHLGHNPIDAEGVLDIVKALMPRASPTSQLRYLDLENMLTTKDILPMLEEIKNKRPWLEIRLGGILSNYKLVGPDPRKIFLKRANYVAMKPKKKKKRKNFGQFVLSLDNSIVSKQTFQKLIKRYKLKLTMSLVEEIMNAFAIGDDAVDQGALKAFYMKEYPDTQPAPPKSKKKVKKKRRKPSNTKSAKKNVDFTMKNSN